MPRIPRKELIDPTEVGIFHCINRCVRRAFLCGNDPFSGKNCVHRKVWLQDCMQFVADGHCRAGPRRAIDDEAGFDRNNPWGLAEPSPPG